MGRNSVLKHPLSRAARTLRRAMVSRLNNTSHLLSSSFSAPCCALLLSLSGCSGGESNVITGNRDGVLHYGNGTEPHLLALPGTETAILLPAIIGPAESYGVLLSAMDDDETEPRGAPRDDSWVFTREDLEELEREALRRAAQATLRVDAIRALTGLLRSLSLREQPMEALHRADRSAVVGKGGVVRESTIDDWSWVDRSLLRGVRGVRAPS